MKTINGVLIHPGFFKPPKRFHVEHRAAAFPSVAKLKGTVTKRPKAPAGKYAMPVVAVIGAVASFTAGAAIATAANATIGAMIMGGAMMVGAAMTVVGTVTGNQKLTKWGGILSAVGGVGAMGLGMMGGLTEAAAGATGTESLAGGVNAEGLGINTTVDPSSIATSIPGADAAAGASGAAGDVIGGTTGASGGSSLNAAPTASTPATGGAMTPPDVTPTPTAATTPSATPAPTTVTEPLPTAGDGGAMMVGKGTVNVPDGLTSEVGEGLDKLEMKLSSPLKMEGLTMEMPKNADPGLWDKFKAEVKQNPELWKTISGGVGDMAKAYANKDLTEAQLAQMRANTAATDANTAMAREQIYKQWLKTNYYNKGKMPPPGARPPGG